VKEPIKTLIAGVLIGIVSLIAMKAQAQDWPQRPLRFVVITPAGGAPDYVARTLASRMSGLLGQPIVVENRPGGGGNIATAAVANAAPDGYTFLITGNNHAVNPILLPNPGFDYVRSFAPVGLIASGNYLLVASPSLAAKNVSEVLALARAKPGALSFAVTQIGTPAHLGAELFLQLGKVNMTIIPYTGVAPAMSDLLNSRVDLMISAFPAVIGLIDSKQIKALAVTRSTRSPVFPNVPTIAESGLPDFDLSGWICLMAPAGTSPAIIARINALMHQVLAEKEVTEAFAEQGLDVKPSSPEELANFMQREEQQWAGVLAKASMR
jgi:tripartite-type tricarboxylate transporter receptor subunit TctC